MGLLQREREREVNLKQMTNIILGWGERNGWKTSE